MKDAARLDPLRQAFERLKERSFPNDSDDEQSSELHADLVEYDGYIAGRITTLLGGGQLHGSDLKSDDSLRQRLEALSESSSQGAAAATKYLSYLDELDSLLFMARFFAR
jgi:hypothetical protein